MNLNILDINQENLSIENSNDGQRIGRTHYYAINDSIIGSNEEPQRLNLR